MSRLTEWVEDDFARLSGSVTDDEAINKLAEYEDSGLRPEDVERMQDRYGRGLTLRAAVGERMEAIRDIPDELLQKIGEAYPENRLRILPCKVGATLYEPARGQISEYRVKSFTVYGESLWINWELTKGFVYRNAEGVKATEIGKTVFLAREEAAMDLL